MANQRLGSRSHNIVYSPPSWDTIHGYARSVSLALAQDGTPSFADPEVVRGLANFIKVVATIRAKQLNAEAEKSERLAA